MKKEAQPDRRQRSLLQFFGKKASNSNDQAPPKENPQQPVFSSKETPRTAINDAACNHPLAMPLSPPEEGGPAVGIEILQGPPSAPSSNASKENNPVVTVEPSDAAAMEIDAAETSTTTAVGNNNAAAAAAKTDFSIFRFNGADAAGRSQPKPALQVALPLVPPPQTAAAVMPEESAIVVAEKPAEKKGSDVAAEKDEEINEEEEEEEPEVNAYELERLERIRRNQEVMRNLGLGTGGAASLAFAQTAAAPAKKARRPAAPRKRQAAAEPTAPLRRSTRQRGGGRGGDAEGGASVMDDAFLSSKPEERREDEETELQFDDSSVHRYVCEVLQNSSSRGGDSSARIFPPSAEQEGEGGRSIRSFARLTGAMVDSTLLRCYSVDWRPGLVAAAGKDGHACVWGSRALEEGTLLSTHCSGIASLRERNNGGEDHQVEEEEGGEPEIEPLLSHRLHKGWISDVQFIGSSGSGEGGGGGLLLLSAGNDGVVCVWDVAKSASSSKQRGELPRCLVRDASLHSGGIFSMHGSSNTCSTSGGKIVTGSKDCSVVVSMLDNRANSLSVVRRFEDAHDGVVKCVRWRIQPSLSDFSPSSAATAFSPDVFASCGNDRVVKITDLRDGVPGGGGLEFATGHSSTVNCLRWSPGDENLILTVSNDPTLLLHDLRNPSQPLHVFSGHITSNKAKGIYQPAFVAGGTAVATAGDPASRLSLYSIADGKTISRGDVDVSVGATFCGEAPGAPLLCSGNRCVAMFAPQWK